MHQLTKTTSHSPDDRCRARTRWTVFTANFGFQPRFSTQSSHESLSAEMKMLHVCVRVWVCVRVLLVCANLSVYMWPDGHKRGIKFQKALKRKTVWQRKEYNVDWVICGNPANEIPLLSTSEEPTHGSTLRLQRVQGGWLLTLCPFPHSGREECGRRNFII